MNEQKKLFRVTVEYEILVSAMDETEAERIANRNLHEATAGTDPDMMLTSEITEREAIPHVWRGCPPFGETSRLVEDFFPEAA